MPAAAAPAGTPPAAAGRRPLVTLGSSSVSAKAVGSAPRASYRQCTLQQEPDRWFGAPATISPSIMRTIVAEIQGEGQRAWAK